MVRLIGKEISEKDKSTVKLLGKESDLFSIPETIPETSPFVQEARTIRRGLADPVESNLITQLIRARGQEGSVPDLESQLGFGERVARTALRAPFPTLLAEDVSAQLLGRESPITTGISKFNVGLPFGLGDEFQAALNTAAEVVSGNLPRDPERNFLEDLKDAFDFHKEAKRLQVERQAAINPKAAFAGEVASLIPKIPLFRGGLGSGKLIGTSALIGGAEGFGRSEASLLDDPIQVAKDITTTASIAGAIGGAGGLAKLGGAALLPKKLNDVAGYFRVAGGGDPSKAGKVLAGKPGELPPQVRGFQLSKKEGILDIKKNFVVQAGKERLPTIDEIIRRPRKAFAETGRVLQEKGRRAVSYKSKLDYDKLRTELNESLALKRSAKLELLDRHLKNKTYDLNEVYGFTKGKASTAIDDILALEDDLVRSGTGTEEQLSAVRQLRIDMGRAHATPRQIEEINRNLFMLGKRGVGKNLPESSPTKKILDTRARGEEFLKRELGKSDLEAAKSYKDLSKQAFEQASFSDAADEGASISLLEHGRDPRFEKGILSQALQNQAAGSGGGTNISIPQLLGSAARLAEKTAGVTLSGASKLLGIPAVNAYLATIFSSYDGKRIHSSKDKELMAHYIRRSRINPRRKAKAIAQLNEDGTFDQNLVPERVMSSAKKRIDDL